MSAHATDMGELAKRLVAFEGSSDLGSNTSVRGHIGVIEKLQILLTRFAGADGYMALMRRALALARVEMPGLDKPTLGISGIKTSLEKLTDEAGAVVIANLLDLMVVFIGGALTMTLLNEMWPMKTGEK